MNNGNGKSLSWAVVIICLIAFWPVGLFLLYRKLSSDRSASMGSGTALTVIGWILACIGAIAFFGIVADGSGGGGLVVAIAFIIGGALLIRKGGAMKKDGERFRRYIDLVVNQRNSSIDAIASAMGVKYEAARDDLRHMLGRGFFPNAYIHEENRAIILPVAEAGAAGASVVVTCKGCGANNTVAAGHVGECEYCGSPISGDKSI